MKKSSAKTVDDSLRGEYDLSLLKGGVRGKYYRRATSSTNLVLIEPDLANLFPDSDCESCVAALGRYGTVGYQ